MLAIIRSGSKQYIVSPGDKIKIERVKEKKGEEIVFDKVLLIEDRGRIEIGNPFLEGKKIIGKVIDHGFYDKVIVFRYKSKTRRKKKRGHRQPFTLIEIIRDK